MTRKEVLSKAEECVCGHREQDYGSPEQNFGFIAKLWGAYLRTYISAKDVAMLMCLFKIARIKTSPAGGTADSFVDLAGYAACGGEIYSNEAAEPEPLIVPSREERPYTDGSISYEDLQKIDEVLKSYEGKNAIMELG